MRELTDGDIFSLLLAAQVFSRLRTDEEADGCSSGEENEVVELDRMSSGGGQEATRGMTR